MQFNKRQIYIKIKLNIADRQKDFNKKNFTYYFSISKMLYVQIITNIIFVKNVLKASQIFEK